MKTVQLPLTGACECGQLAYEISGSPHNLWACHCRNCQRQTGSAFVLSMKVQQRDFRFTKGEPAHHTWVSDAGRSRTGLFCDGCGNRIANVSPGYAETPEGFASVRAGTLDDTSWVEPTGHIWLKSAQPWIEPKAGDVLSDAQPEDDQGFRERFEQMFSFVK